MASGAKSSIPKLFSEITEWIDDMRSWPNLMYGDIYNYLITSEAVDGEEMKNFKSLQSYNYFQSGNVDRNLHFVAPDNNIVLKANVRSSQTVSRTNDAYVVCTKEGTVEHSLLYMHGWLGTFLQSCGSFIVEN